MTSGSNPFRPDFGIEPPVLAGRDDLMQSIATALAAGPTNRNFSSLLLGPRGVGKTALLSAVSNHAASAGWRVLAVDSLVSPPDHESVTAQISERCVEHLDDITPPKSFKAKGVHLPIIGGGIEWERPRPTKPTLRRLLDTLVAATLEEGGAGVLVTVDEMHNLEVPDASLLSSVLQRLTKIEKKQLAFIGVGLPSLEHTLLPNKGFTFFQRCLRHRIKNIPLSDAMMAIGEPLQHHGAHISCSDLKRAASATLGYGFAIQSVGYHLWEESDAPTNEITSEHTTEAIMLMEEDVGQYVVMPTWSRLSAGDKNFLIALAGTKEPARLTDVSKRILGNNSGVKIYKQRLLDQGVIIETGAGHIMFSNVAVRERAIDERDLQSMFAEEAERRLIQSAVERSARSVGGQAICAHPMPRAKTRCVLLHGHRGAHRSR